MSNSKNPTTVKPLGKDATQADIREYCRRNKPLYRTTVNKVGKARTRA